MVTAVDLFAGCGGLSKGFENAGINIVAAFENWTTAADCYRENFSHPVFRNDLGEIDEAVEIIENFAPDMIIGGPPCQDFSHAGKRVEAGRASLTESFAYIVVKVKPRCFLMENVERAQKSDAYSRAKEVFKTSGYGLTERVLTASYCGVPQRRKRFFCIGVLRGKDGELNDFLSKHLSEKEMSVRDYLGDSLDTEHYYRHPRNYSRRAVFSIDEPAPTMRGVNRPIPKGYPGHAGDTHDVGHGVRPLTTLERSLIQTFPADFRWVGSKTDREQMVGNAVPVNLAAFVARSIREYLSVQNTERLNLESLEFEQWLIAEKSFGERSASDVLSRLRRADKIIPVLSAASPASYLAVLGEVDNFRTTVPSVKSQIRRAVHLYAEYLGFSYN